MQAAPWVWNAATLDRFLAGPLAAVPGTSMTYDGIADARDRRDLIAYLRALDASPRCRAVGQAKRQE
jgi:cytochrome c